VFEKEGGRWLSVDDVIIALRQVCEVFEEKMKGEYFGVCLHVRDPEKWEEKFCLVIRVNIERFDNVEGEIKEKWEYKETKRKYRNNKVLDEHGKWHNKGGHWKGGRGRGRSSWGTNASNSNKGGIGGNWRIKK